MAAKWDPQALIRAAKKSGVTYKVDDDWLTCPHPYDDDDAQMVGLLWHHTGCGSLSTGNMPSLGYCRYPGELGKKSRACHIVVGRDGTMQIIAGKACYHAGEGGPLKVNGVTVPEDMGNHYFVGIEIEASSSTKINKRNVQTPKWGLNPAQVEAVARFCAALADDLKWPTSAFIRHQDWAPRRKIDVGIPLSLIHDEIEKYRAPVKPKPVPKPKPEPKPPVVVTPPTPVKPPVVAKPSKPVIRLSQVQPTKSNASVAIVQEALRKEVGLAKSAKVGTFDSLTKTAYAKWQRKLKFAGSDADGVPGIESLRELGKRQGFSVRSQ